MIHIRLAGNLEGEALDEVQRILTVQQAVSVAAKAWRAHLSPGRVPDPPSAHDDKPSSSARVDRPTAPG